MAITAEVYKLLIELDELAAKVDHRQYGLPYHSSYWTDQAAVLIEDLIARRIEAENYGGM